MSTTPHDAERRRAVLGWGERSLRDLPWRRTRDPWAILVSETMLQQTQVARVVDRLPRFLERFPTPADCAAAPAGDVVEEWAGLGYNRRPLNLHRAAAAMVERHGGRLPERLGDLLALPGVGPYTARAVRAFAHELPAAVVDTNIGRVLARWDGERLTPKQAQARADALAPDDQPWHWNQSIMELGALVCTKRSPACAECPVHRWCGWRGVGDDPAVGSAAVSTPQARFEGSDRQLRGRLVDALRSGPVERSTVAVVVDEPDRVRVEMIVAGLVRDGLAVEDGESLRLP
ncbi:MAG: A/G-specific adenine glycosylase [Actinomycetota bacterium]